MSDSLSDSAYLKALEDFTNARQRAALRQVLGWLRRENVDLLSFEEIRQRLRAQPSTRKTLSEIPLDAIVGSVNRYQDFTRDFLPKASVSAERWARVEAATASMQGLPPIEVYQIGEVYFVNDGNHRVSVARSAGSRTINAYVTQINSRVPLSPGDSPQDLILKLEQADFLEYTRLDRLHPESDWSASAPEAYCTLSEHIAVHRYYMGLELQRPVEEEEAVLHWYDSFYLPIVNLITERGLLRDFPGKTQVDLYLWLCEYRTVLEERLGGPIDVAHAADNLAGQFSPLPERVAARVSSKLIDAMLPDAIEAGPPPGELRRRKQLETEPRLSGSLFSDILVPLNGSPAAWNALELAQRVAQRENARLAGLHVLPAAADPSQPAAMALQSEFERRCQNANLPARWSFAKGEVARCITERAGLVDLIVINLSYPPGANPISRLSSGFRALVQRCPRPLLVTPETTSPLQHALLAYDGGVTAREALFVAAYLAGRWQIDLTVVTILNEKTSPEIQQQARGYLEKQAVQANFLSESGAPAQAILHAAERSGSDFVIMGGYGSAPLLNVLLDSVADQVLRQSSLPMLLCR